MNIKHISLVFAAAALLGCSKNPIEEVKPSEQLTNLELASVTSAETKVAIDGTDFPETGEIGLFLFKDETAETPYGKSGYTNVKYAYNSSNSKWTASPSIKVGSEAGYLFGYYPYDSEVTSIKAIPVKSSLNGDDVMYASSQTAITDRTAANTSITMNHALARVSIKVINKGYTGKAKLSQIKFEDAKIAETGTLNALNGSITATESDVTLDVPTADQTIIAAGTTYECLLVPSDEISSKQTVKLTLTIDGQDMTATLSGDNGVLIAQNTKSNITINLSNSGISVQTVSVDEWNVVEVGGHKVTVKFADEQNIEKDVLMTAYKDGNVVKIEAFAKSGNALGYFVTGKATCSRTKTGSLYVFTISGISSDVTVEIGYKVAVEKLTLDRTSVNPAKGWAVHLVPELSPADATIKDVTWSSNNPDIAPVDVRGNVTAVAQGEATITATAKDGSGVTASCKITVGPAIPGSLTHEFSVSATKKVHFSKGNLWADGSNALHFEDAQWKSTQTSDGKMDASHVSHFTWSSTVEAAVGNSKSGSNLFCDESHKVSVDGGEAIYYALSKDEWKYLINKNNDETIRKGKYKYGVTVCDKANCLILAPDDFEGTIEASYDATAWATAEAAGLVCLPAAGFRNSSDVFNVGKGGRYWSSIVVGAGSSYYVNFGSGNVDPDYTGSRSDGHSIRLITECQ